MKGVQCYELFGGIALKNHTFSFHFFISSGGFLLQCAGDIEADHIDSGIVMDSADRYRETQHLGE